MKLAMTGWEIGYFDDGAVFVTALKVWIRAGVGRGRAGAWVATPQSRLAMVAAKHDKQQRAFYERLLSQGKKPLVALTAIMRKLVVICNAVLRPLAALETA